MNISEIEAAFSRFKICPKCNSRIGFWLGMKNDRPFVHCKSCGGKFDFYEILEIGEKKKSGRLGSFRR